MRCSRLAPLKLSESTVALKLLPPPPLDTHTHTPYSRLGATSCFHGYRRCLASFLAWRETSFYQKSIYGVSARSRFQLPNKAEINPDDNQPGLMIFWAIKLECYSPSEVFQSSLMFSLNFLHFSLIFNVLEKVTRIFWHDIVYSIWHNYNSILLCRLENENHKSFLSRVSHVLIRSYPYNLILRFFFMGNLWIFRLILAGWILNK